MKIVYGRRYRGNELPSESPGRFPATLLGPMTLGQQPTLGSSCNLAVFHGKTAGEVEHHGVAD